MFRGREISHTQLRICMRLAEEVASLGVIEKQPRVEGRNMTMILVPRTNSVNA